MCQYLLFSDTILLPQKSLPFETYVSRSSLIPRWVGLRFLGEYR